MSDLVDKTFETTDKMIEDFQKDVDQFTEDVNFFANTRDKPFFKRLDAVKDRGVNLVINAIERNCKYVKNEKLFRIEIEEIILETLNNYSDEILS